MKSAGSRVIEARGRERQLRRIFNRSPVPMALLDNSRRTLAANSAARLMMRLTFDQLRDRPIDDFASPGEQESMRSEWAEMLRTGHVAGSYDFTLPDGSRLRTVYCAVKNLLPAKHLVVGMPAGWPDDELLTAEDGDSRTTNLEGLSRREIEVLMLAARGADSVEIADELTLSPATVKTHLRNAYKKLGARNRAHAVAIALQRGYLDPSEG